MMMRSGLMGGLAATLCFAACGGGSNELVLGPCPAEEPFCQKFQGRSWSDMKDDLTFAAAKEY